MRKETVENIRKLYRLPSSEMSKRAMRAILADAPQNYSDFPEEYRAELGQLFELHLVSRAKLDPGTGPRTAPIFQLIKQRYPEFQFREESGQLQIESYFEGIRPTALALLLGLIPPERLTAKPLSSSSCGRNERERLEACELVFDKEDLAIPAGANRARFIEWLRQGARGESLTVLSPVCPDYATEPSPTGHPRYTFDAVNGGNGLMAQRVYKAAPALRSLFRRLRLRVTHVVCVADFEAFSVDNLRRLSIAEEQFQSKIAEQLVSLKRSAPFAMTVCTVSNLCGGKDAWLQELQAARGWFATHDLNGLSSKRALREVSLSRASLYRRLLRLKSVPDAVADALVLNSATELATMGKRASRTYPNVLILSADHPHMSPFYAALVPTPVLHMRRVLE